MNEHISLPPMAIVTIFHDFLKLMRRSCLMRCTSNFAMYGISADDAPISAILNLLSKWYVHESRFEYPVKFGLYSLRMFGNVDAFRQFHWPPMLHDRPRFSIIKSWSCVDDAPLPAVSESPSAAMTSISPVANETKMDFYLVWSKEAGGVEWAGGRLVSCLHTWSQPMHTRWHSWASHARHIARKRVRSFSHQKFALCAITRLAHNAHGQVTKCSIKRSHWPSVQKRCIVYDILASIHMMMMMR